MIDRLLSREARMAPEHVFQRVRASVSHKDKVSDFTHNFYKYPACFHPSFPREVIRSFSEKGDTVVDPFVGGGTTAVEAMAAGRNFVGFDINELAIFSSKFKTLLLSDRDILMLDKWSDQLSAPTANKNTNESNFQLFNAPPRLTGFAKFIDSKIQKLQSKNAAMFARGTLLRIAQIEVEHRHRDVNSRILLHQYQKMLNILIEEAIIFREHVKQINHTGKIDLVGTDFTDDSSIIGISGAGDIKLAVTSPPYPERHILYHKWQVRGRAETRLPYWIIGSSQVEHEAFYTMGSRDTEYSLELYLSHMHAVFLNLNKLLRKNGVVVQMISFSDKKRQLIPYLDAMSEAGFQEIRNVNPSSYDGRLWRDVPNRRWYNVVEKTDCKEVVLFHRKKRDC